jgi:uncharacterized protein (TIGR02266 family)
MPTAEHRRFARKAIPVEFRGRDAEGDGQLVFESEDISAGGTFLKSDLLLEPGERMTLEFRVPAVPRLLKAQARVVWARRFPQEGEAAGMGVEFSAMSEEDRDVLTRYLGA